jgi:cytochrome P450
MPGPMPSYPLGTLLDFKGAQPWDVCAAYEKKYGGVTLIWETGKPVVVVSDAELIRDVLITNEQDYYKDDPTLAFRPVLKVTEFNENAEEWRRLRADEPLSMDGYEQWLATQESVVQKVVDDHLSRWTAASGPVDLLPISERMIYDAFNACMVGKQFDDGDYRAFYKTSDMATKRMQIPSFILFRPINPVFYAARARHFGIFEKVVREARQNPNPNANDMLSVFLRKRTDIPDEMIAMYLGNVHAGGVFSTGTALVNTLYFLGKHPEIADKLRESLMQDPNSRYLDQVLHECLRYYPPVPMFFRNVIKTKSTQLGKYTLPPDTVVYLSAQGVHHSTRYWTDPERFDPERWNNGPVSLDAYEADTFLPFGRGKRICIGATMAMLCMKIMLKSIVTRTQMKMDPGIKLEQFFHCGVAEPKNVVASFVARS